MISIKKTYNWLRTLATGIILCSVLFGCGYKTGLKPPEPRRVEIVTDLKFDLACKGIELNWAPALFDSRGNPLDEPATYLVYRKRGLPFDQKTEKVKKTIKPEQASKSEDTETSALEGDIDDRLEPDNLEPVANETGNENSKKEEIDEPEYGQKNDIDDSSETVDLDGALVSPKPPDILPQEFAFSLVAVVPGRPVTLTTAAIADERIEWTDTGAPAGPTYLPGKIKYRIPSRLPEKAADSSDGLVAGYVYTYFVIALDAVGVSSAPSTPIECPWVAIPAAPENPIVQVSKNNVHVSWTKPSENCLGKPLDDISSYEIFRSEALTPEVFKHVFTVDGNKLEKIDNTVVMDSVYQYKIRAVIFKSIPGEFSNSVTADTANVYPPSPPTQLTGAVRPAGVFLNWRASEDKDIAGYRVYRRSSKQVDFKLLNPENLVISTTYIDETVKKDETYSYRLTSVDKSANTNESEPGNTWTVTVR